MLQKPPVGKLHLDSMKTGIMPQGALFHLNKTFNGSKKKRLQLERQQVVLLPLIGVG